MTSADGPARRVSGASNAGSKVPRPGRGARRPTIDPSASDADPSALSSNALQDRLDSEKAEVRASGDRADRKAQILLGITGVVMVLLINAIQKWFDGQHASIVSKVTLLIAFLPASISLAVFCIAAVLLMNVVRPDLGEGTDLEQAAWNRLAKKAKTGPEVLEIIACETDEARVGRHANLIYQLTFRTVTKHQRIIRATVWMRYGVILAVAASMLRSLPYLLHAISVLFTRLYG
jgi:hypothetical protein